MTKIVEFARNAVDDRPAGWSEGISGHQLNGRRGLRCVFALKYLGSMKVKTSVTLSEDILKSIDRMTRKGESRSEAIERLLRESLGVQARRAADLEELALINRHADRLNAEVEDVLRYQADL